MALEPIMQPTIVVVEDEEPLREAVAEYLTDRGFRVLVAADGPALRDIARTESFGVVVLDISMPGEDGLSLARWLRTLPARPGIIFATAAGSSVDRIVGLEIGADDYVVKPYDLRELLARIRALHRRLTSAPAAAEAAPVTRTAKVGPHTLNFDARRLIDGSGNLVDLTSTEFDLLTMLVTKPNRILSRSQLLGGGTGHDGDESERSVDIRVTRLRRKIETDPQHPSLIRTVRGEGYMFVPGP